MRIIIDLQGAQATNARRGIGRFAIALARAMVARAGKHEILLALNTALAGSLEPIRAAFDGLLDPAQIKVWQGLNDLIGNDPTHRWRRLASERIHDCFLASLNPDIVHVASHLEGLVDDAVSSIGSSHPPLTMAATLYDLIPFIFRDAYLQDATYERWYKAKIQQLRRADHLLATSERNRDDATSLLGIPPDHVSNISAAVDERFKPNPLTPGSEATLRKRLGLDSPFIMYAGGINYCDNVEGLIRGFALMPTRLRETRQLAIVCAIHDGERQRLEQIARDHHLARGRLVCTGSVSDDDLVGLYNLCEVFCSPSIYEGFGFPLLEAMACGAPAIAANSSSLPEVLNHPDALFAPDNDQALAERLARVLADEAFRKELRNQGLARAKEFSWDASAERALAGLEACVDRKKFERRPPQRGRSMSRPSLIYVSPLPPEPTGIADYSAELLEELKAYYEIDAVVKQDPAACERVDEACTVRTLEWFYRRPVGGERLLYHFANSPFHEHMFQMLTHCPGVVVLHDFFLSYVIDYPKNHETNAWTDSLYRSHGYGAVVERFDAADRDALLAKYPCNLPLLQSATGVIIHSDFTRQLGRQWFGSALEQDWVTIPPLRAPVQLSGRDESRSELGLSPTDFVVCSFGVVSPCKASLRLIEAWVASSLARDASCHLVLVGEAREGPYTESIYGRIDDALAVDNILITGFVPRDLYNKWLATADLAVQTDTNSRGETSRAVLDCMASGVPTIINRHGPMAELPGESVLMVPEMFSERDLVQALEALRSDPATREKIALGARRTVEQHHSPRRVAAQYFEAIETFRERAARGRAGAVHAVGKLDGTAATDADLEDAARAIAQSLQPVAPKKQLLVDISELAQQDAGTGIQRVVRNVLQILLEQPPAGYRVEPVYATATNAYRYARRFTLRFLRCPSAALDDEPIEVTNGDILLMLDLNPEVAKGQAAQLAHIRDCGTKIYYLIYDLLWRRMPQFFVNGTRLLLDSWLRAVISSDGAICISKAVADELWAHINRERPERALPFKIGWFHLGTGPLTASRYAKMNVEPFSAQIGGANPFVLMVGTVEARKGHTQVLDAFEELWRRGVALDLVFVGKEGWLVESLIARMRRHRELGRRFFWYDQAKDAMLEAAYDATIGILMASQGEGFGLPLIEAAQHGRPILARDLPVFREVAGEYATYFDGGSGVELADALEAWFAALQQGVAAQSSEIPVQTWEQSTKQLLSVFLNGNWYRKFESHGLRAPDTVVRGHVKDPIAPVQAAHDGVQSVLRQHREKPDTY
jgi:glycosyltransferase involved in cell wall biosynthesis